MRLPDSLSCVEQVEEDLKPLLQSLQRMVSKGLHLSMPYPKPLACPGSTWTGAVNTLSRLRGAKIPAYERAAACSRGLFGQLARVLANPMAGQWVRMPPGLPNLSLEGGCVPSLHST